MGGEIRVQTGPLTAAGDRLTGAGGEVTGLAGSIDALQAAGAATGDPAAANAYSRMCIIWSAELARLGRGLSDLGRLTTGAGILYEAVERAIMPPTNGGPAGP